MEISKKFYNDISGLITQFNKNNTYELEAKYNKGKPLTRELFYNSLQYFMSINNNVNNIEEVLDINIKKDTDFYRVSIKGKDDVSEYCKSNLIPNIDKIVVMKKTRISRVQYEEFNFNIDLSDEVIVEDPIKSEILESLHSVPKGFRYKKRFTFIEDNKIQYDLTIVKTSKTIGNDYICHMNFASTGIMANPETYEIEMELIKRNPKQVDSISKLFISSIIQLYSIINDEEHVITEKEKKEVFEEYLRAYHSDKKKPDGVIRNRALEKPHEYFLGPQPITLELKNLLKPNLGIVSILENYTVTEKADGERCNMFINKFGKCYLVNNRLTVKYTGIKLEELRNTLLDGEHITKDVNGSSTNIYAIFDIYYHNGSMVANLPLITEDDNNRYKLMKDFEKKYKDKFADSMELICKEFKYGENILNECKDILDKNKQKHYSYKIDGLIFTPKIYSVGGFFKSDTPNMFGTWNLQFKWKPPEDNTIDFLVKYQRGDKGAYSILFSKNKGYKILNLYVGYKQSQWTDITARNFLEGKLKRDALDYIERLFKPGDVEDTFSQSYVESKKEYNGRGACENNDEIEDDTIIEFKYEDKKWIPIRARKDKTEKYKNTGSLSRTANDYGSALNVWRSIVNPITEDLITGQEQMKEFNESNEEAYYYRTLPREKMASKRMLDFHNYWVKSQLIKNVSGKESLMDIACGQAGDLYKWRESDFSKIFGIDYSKDNIQNPRNGAYARLISALSDPKYNFSRGKYVFLTMDGGEKINPEYINNIKEDDDKYLSQILWGITKAPDQLKSYENYVTNGFDVISCQFALHYFFENEDKLTNFTYNVNKYLKNGGYFIGTCLDGQQVKKLLKGKRKNQHVVGKQDERILWDICKKYDSKVEEIDYGEEIDVYMESIGKVTKEYLVSFTKLIEKLLPYNIVLAKEEDLEKFESKEAITSFKDVYAKALLKDETSKYSDSVKNMSNEEKQYSFLNSYFVFVKKQPSGGSTEVPRKIRRKIIIQS
jgi:hypothetical protein